MSDPRPDYHLSPKTYHSSRGTVQHVVLRIIRGQLSLGAEAFCGARNMNVALSWSKPPTCEKCIQAQKEAMHGEAEGH